MKRALKFLNIARFAVPGTLLLLSLIPSYPLRILLFGALAYPMPWLPQFCWYTDKGFLTPAGAILVAVVWSLLILAAGSVLHVILRHQAPGRRNQRQL